MRLLILLALLTLTGCGSAPVFLGDTQDGALFVVRLTDFRLSTAIPGVPSADGCQLSVRGEAPPGVLATLSAGECGAWVTDPDDFAIEP